MAFEFIVFFTAFKYVFVEGGEQALVGIGTLVRIGYRETLKITLIGLAVGIALYFLFLNAVEFFPTNLVEIALGVGLLYFSHTMFKEFLEREEKDVTKYKIGYFYIAILEAIENSVALATFSLIDMASAISGAVLAIGLIVGLLYLGIIKRIPLKLTRLVSGILLAATGIPLIIYGLDIPYPEIMQWLIPPLS
ncbi:hypothetical protein QVH35_09165 [Candidatus Nitrosotenuis chungbukensis]|uniref:hypothetical protein n=1 Tax=Candidatus Nitrosotenuis chungbukensis TaxID=1353246 RepID=UPI0026712D11|nr:hypothetical protein [Candidatus Nitrosotenuis chungbukensis]WKT57525.1 hypothetical protein QVH35_09165 [Candidatus Nitrosotenuis chungbukensis]